MEAVFGAGQPANAAALVETEISTDANSAHAIEPDEIAETETGEPEFDFGAAFDDLRQEIRRLGRELFKTNRQRKATRNLSAKRSPKFASLPPLSRKFPNKAPNRSMKPGLKRKPPCAATCCDWLTRRRRVCPPLMA